MKKLSFCVLSLFLSASVVHSQEILDVFAKEACECIKAKDVSAMKGDQLNMELGLCIMGSLSDHQGEYEEKLNIDITDQASMQKLGEQIGLKMVVTCPEVMMKIAGASEQPAAQGGTLTGTIQELGGTEFAYLIVKDDQGRDHKMLWLRYFQGSEALKADSGLKGKKVSVNYNTMECYSPSLKDYYNCKEITSLKMLD